MKKTKQIIFGSILATILIVGGILFFATGQDKFELEEVPVILYETSDEAKMGAAIEVSHFGGIAGTPSGKSFSMYPMIKTGDWIALINYDYNDLEEGMTVAFQRQIGDIIIVHTLWYKVDDGWKTRGTNNKENDSVFMNESEFKYKLHSIHRPKNK